MLALECLSTYRHVGTGNQFFLLHTITHYHQVFKCLGVFQQYNLEEVSAAGGDILLQETDVGDMDHSTFGYLQHEIAVAVGDGTVGGPQLNDVGSDHRLPISRGDTASDLSFLLLCL